MREMSALTALPKMTFRNLEDEIEDELEDMLEDCHVRVFFIFSRDVRKMTEMSALLDIFWTFVKKVKKTRTCQSSISSSNSSSNFLDVVVGRTANADICHFLDVPRNSEKTRTCPSFNSSSNSSSNSSFNFLDVVVGREANADISVIF